MKLYSINTPGGRKTRLSAQEYVNYKRYIEQYNEACGIAYATNWPIPNWSSFEAGKGDEIIANLKKQAASKTATTKPVNQAATTTAATTKPASQVTFVPYRTGTAAKINSANQVATTTTATTTQPAPVQEKKQSAMWVWIVGGIAAAAGLYFLTRKKKK